MTTLLAQITNAGTNLQALGALRQRNFRWFWFGNLGQAAGQIISVIMLSDAWVDRVLAQVHLADEVKQVGEERKKAEQRLRRLSRVPGSGVTRVEGLDEERPPRHP